MVKLSNLLKKSFAAKKNTPAANFATGVLSSSERSVIICLLPLFWLQENQALQVRLQAAARLPL